LRQDFGMLDVTTLDWIDQLTLTRDLRTPGERAEFFARVRRHEFVAVRRGAYVAAEYWSRMDRHERYRARVKTSVTLADEKLLVSHDSAAALWRLPRLGPYPQAIHVLHAQSSGGRSTTLFARHAVASFPQPEIIEGIPVTPLARTAIDLIRAGTFAEGVVVADAVLRRTAYPLAGLPGTAVTRADLVREAVDVPIRLGSAKARRVIEFADGLADRPGESISRVNIALAGLTMPQLQVPIRGASGRRWVVDFWWPESNLIGEFDGKSKYTDPEFLRGRTPAQVVYDEKVREDDLRATDRSFSRWPWATAISMPKLRRHLAAAGVRVQPRGGTSSAWPS
jgi:hypothetical protein